mgnify:CR=1 FL=1
MTARAINYPDVLRAGFKRPGSSWASWCGNLQCLISQVRPDRAKLTSLAAAFLLQSIWLGAGVHALAESETASTREDLYAQGLLALNSHDYELAFDILLPLAEQGHSDAQSKIAHMYYWGEGREPDYVQHFEWSLRSAQAGNPIGQFDVASDYFVGRGVARNAKAGVKWITLSADGGDEYAQVALGVMHLTGDHVETDLKRGHRYLNLALEQNEPRALVFAAGNYWFGRFGVEVDRDRGLELIQRAAEHNHSGAQLTYGVHLLGEARSQEDIANAGKWLFLADMAGCERASESLALLRGSAPPSAIFQAMSLADEWMALAPQRAPHDHRDYKVLFCDPGPILNAVRLPEAGSGATQD